MDNARGLASNAKVDIITDMRPWHLCLSVAVIGSLAAYLAASILPPPTAFEEVTTSDPLFYDPALNVDDLATSLGRLEATEKKLFDAPALFSEESKKLYPEGRRLFPIPFLEKLRDISTRTGSVAARRSSWLNAYLLVRDYEDALTKYKSTLEALGILLEKNWPSISRRMVFPGAHTTPEVAAKDLLLLVKNADALREEIKLRKRCLFGAGCQNLSSAAERITAWAKREKENGPAIPEAVRFTAEQAAPRAKPFLKTEGPYAARSACWGKNGDGTPKMQVFYLYHSETGAFPELASEQYFADYSRGKGVWRTAQYFLERGIRYRRQPATNTYACTDNTYLADIFLLAWAKNEVAQRPSAIPELKGAEEKFLAAGSPSMYNLADLALAYYEVLARGDAPLGDEQKKLENRLLAFRGKLVGLPDILNHMASEFGAFFFDNEFSPDNQELYLAVVRSNYSILFLPFSEPLWIIGDKPRYLLDADVSGESPAVYKMYNDLLSSGFTADEIAHFTIPTPVKIPE